jgi:hypothetical protein
MTREEAAMAKDPEAEQEEGAENDESSSDVPPSKMKGAKPNPLRRWAQETA